MANFTTTQRTLLAKLTAKTRAIYEEALRIRNKDYDGWIPLEVLEARKLKAKVEEHDSLLGGLFKQMTASFGGMMRLDEKLKGKK